MKTGEGTLLFAGSGADFSGSIAVDGGSLAVDFTGKSVLESASSVIIGSGGTLDLTHLDLSDSGNSIGISAGQTFTLSAGASLAFGDLATNTEYQVFDFTGGFVNGWDTTTLTAEHISIGGVTLAALANRVSFELTSTGGFSYELLGDIEIEWNGGNSPSSWNQESNNKTWSSTESGETAFINFDSVVFTSDADLTLEGDIHVHNITLTENVSLKTAGQLTVNGAMTLGEGYSWDFSGDTSLSFTEAQLKSAAQIVVGEGARLVMKDPLTDVNQKSTAFDQVSGTGDVELHLRMDNGVGFDLSGVSGDISIATGRLQVNTSTFNEKSTIHLTTSNSQLVFNSAGAELANDVVLDAATSIHVNSSCKGTISGDLRGEGKKLTKDGDGSLTLSGAVRLGQLDTSKGDVIIDTISALIGNVDAGMGGNARGKVKLAADAYLGITANVWSNSLTGFELEQGAELELRNNNLRIINNSSETASLKTSDKGLYTLSDNKYEIKNAVVIYNGTKNATLSNKLTKVTLVHDGNAAAPVSQEDDTVSSTSFIDSTLTVNHSDNELNGVVANGGNVNLVNLEQATSLNLLEIATRRVVSAYVGTNTETRSAVTVTEAARLSGGAMLDAASLTLADGATLDMVNLGESGVSLCGGALTFGSQVTMGDNLLAIVNEMRGWEETLVLFTEVSGVTLPDATELESSRVLASTVFNNVTSDTLYLDYRVVDNVGSLLVVNVPEPATSSLGLAALVALAARRRRKA